MTNGTNVAVEPATTLNESEKKGKKQTKKSHTSNTSGYSFGSLVHFRDAESAAMFKKANINRFKEQNQKKQKKNDKPVETKAE